MWACAQVFTFARNALNMWSFFFFFFPLGVIYFVEPYRPKINEKKVSEATSGLLTLLNV